MPNLHLRANNIVIIAGALNVGVDGQPFEGEAKITLFGGKNSPAF